MPQLNPAPWFSILMFSWLIFLIVIPPKILKHTFNKEPKLDPQKAKYEPWVWPWP
uniref:ATP synthase complex subunit 8 n=3 Tax=Brycon TaxID=42585 RepID=Q71PM4_9TELE|nr:ATP synthase subunit 8 [Brycon chagrensis]AAQ03500.1 ATP synthase subunit 8 [Brycon guatemalensis]AAQ03534.1 ATP synthase subunit 8 [Brycon n. sp. 'Howes']AAQ03492.1 ATP synthase subunit 8 [Brycon chagrensis]AAQ03494.1 ATP synthase subunit 8 [Brycon chagrensis]